MAIACREMMGGRQLLMYEDEAIHIALSQGIGYEASVAHMIGGYVRKGDMCVDVGANVGYHSLLMCNLLSTYGQVHSFEPNPKPYKLLEMNADLNKFSFWKTYNQAVMQSSGKVQQAVNNGDSCQSEFNMDTEGSIDCVCLDDVFTQTPNFIKIDTEGSEAFVLKGMQRHLKANTSMAMMMEYCPSLVKKHGGSIADMVDCLTMGKFRVYWIPPQGGWVYMSPGSLIDVEKQLPGDTELINLWCVR